MRLLALTALSCIATGCYCSHRVTEDDAGAPPMLTDAGPPFEWDASLPDAGAPPPFTCIDELDELAEAARLAALLEEIGFGPTFDREGEIGTIVERADETLVIERADGTRDRFVWRGHPLSECYIVGEEAEYGVRPDGWHYVIGRSLGFQSFVRPFDGDVPPPFPGPDGDAVTMSFEPVCTGVGPCGARVTQRALWVRSPWGTPSVAVHIGEEVDAPHGLASPYFVVHVGSTEVPVACGDPAPHFRGIVSVVSFETCVC